MQQTSSATSTTPDASEATMITHESWFVRYLLKSMIHVIILVCAFDIYLTVKFHDSLIDIEENPIAKLLIHEQHAIVTHNTDENGKQHTIVHRTADVSALVLCKTLGMIAAQIVLHKIATQAKARYAFAVICPLFILQLCLLGYLILK